MRVEKYGEAQMIVSDSVLPDMSRVNRLLADSYGTLMRIVSGHGGPGDTPDGVRELLDLALEQLRAMRASMRSGPGHTAAGVNRGERARRVQPAGAAVPAAVWESPGSRCCAVTLQV